MPALAPGLAPFSAAVRETREPDDAGSSLVEPTPRAGGSLVRRRAGRLPGAPLRLFAPRHHAGASRPRRRFAHAASSQRCDMLRSNGNGPALLVGYAGPHASRFRPYGRTPLLLVGVFGVGSLFVLLRRLAEPEIAQAAEQRVELGQIAMVAVRRQGLAEHLLAFGVERRRLIAAD